MLLNDAARVTFSFVNKKQQERSENKPKMCTVKIGEMIRKVRVLFYCHAPQQHQKLKPHTQV